MSGGSKYAAALQTLGLPAEWTVGVEVENRTSIDLKVRPGGDVRIVVPVGTSPAGLAALLEDRRAVIAEAVEEAEGLLTAHPVKPLVDGTVFTLVGRDYRLLLVDQDEAAHRATGDDDGVLRVQRGTVEEMGLAIVDWLCEEGEAWARAAGREYECRGGIEGLRYEVRYVDGHWGKYDPRGHRVVLSWWAMGLPRALLDYVHVHELAHATRPEGPDHGTGWCAVMDVWMPDWRRRREALSALERTIWIGDVVAAE